MASRIDNDHFRDTLYAWPEVGLVLLYKNFYHNLLAIADMYTRDRQSSEDVVQEIFVDIWNRHKEIGARRDESIERYLVKAVQYRSASHNKRKLRTAERETRYYYISNTTTTAQPEEPAFEMSDDERLARLIAATFPERERDCILLKMEGMQNRAIAERLGISTKGVERNLTRARKRFKRFGSSVYSVFFQR